MKFNKLQLLTENNIVEVHLKHMHKLSNNALFSIDHVKDNHYHILTRQQIFDNNKLLQYGKQHYLSFSFSHYVNKGIVIEAYDENIDIVNFKESKIIGFFTVSTCDRTQQLFLKKIINKINESDNKNFHLNIECKQTHKMTGEFISEIYKSCAKKDAITALTLSAHFYVDEPRVFVTNLEDLSFAANGPDIHIYASIPTTSIDKFSEILTKYQQTRDKNRFIDELIENGFEDLL